MEGGLKVQSIINRIAGMKKRIRLLDMILLLIIMQTKINLKKTTIRRDTIMTITIIRIKIRAITLIIMTTVVMNKSIRITIIIIQDMKRTNQGINSTLEKKKKAKLTNITSIKASNTQSIVAMSMRKGMDIKIKITMVPPIKTKDMMIKTTGDKMGTITSMKIMATSQNSMSMVRIITTAKNTNNLIIRIEAEIIIMKMVLAAIKTADIKAVRTTIEISRDKAMTAEISENKRIFIKPNQIPSINNPVTKSRRMIRICMKFQLLIRSTLKRTKLFRSKHLENLSRFRKMTLTIIQLNIIRRMNLRSVSRKRRCQLIFVEKSKTAQAEGWLMSKILISMFKRFLYSIRLKMEYF